jgi:hydroxymethylpyrimidine pyrophosphatase-like HAD family hydrolase
MNNVAFIDLDKTFIFSKRSVPRDAGELINCYQRPEDKSRGCWIPKSYLDMLLDLNCEIVIVTARSKLDVDKLNLPFEPAYTVCNFGSSIYKGSELVVQNLSKQDIDTMIEFEESCPDYLPTPTKVHLSQGDVAVWHYVFDSEIEAQHAHNEVDKFINNSDTLSRLVTQRNGRHFDVFPKSCLKETAVKQLISKKYKTFFKLGFGDSIIDHGFMSLCHIAVTPTDSQLFQSLEASNA